MARLLLALLLVPALAAGCLEDAAPAATDGSSASGEAGGGAASPGGADGADGPDITTREASWTATVAAGGMAPSFLGSGQPVERVGRVNLTGVVIAMSWTPATPLTEEMTLRIVREGSVVGEATGPSPLRLAFPGDQAAGELVLYGHPATDPGLSVNQGYTFTLAVFKGLPFDPDFQPA